MRKLRVLALMHESLIPRDDVSGIDLNAAEWKTEYDVVTTLRKMGHEVKPLGVRSDLEVIQKAVDEWKPHIAFNLLEEFDGIPLFDQNVVSHLELLHIPYTGCNPRGLMIGRDKGLTKKILSYHRIPFPDFVVVPKGQAIRRPKRLSFPLIVKSLSEEASLGISQASIVHDDQKLKERVAFIHSNVGSGAIVERYIEGRELYVGVLGNKRLSILPVWELFLDKLPEEARRIATRQVKWNLEYQKKYEITIGEAKNLPTGLAEKIQHLSKRVYRILGLSGYARMDVRLDAAGQIYILEANPNPDIAYGEDFAESAACAGLSYPALLQQIINLGFRWQPGDLG